MNTHYIRFQIADSNEIVESALQSEDEVRHTAVMIGKIPRYHNVEVIENCSPRTLLYAMLAIADQSPDSLSDSGEIVLHPTARAIYSHADKLAPSYWECLDGDVIQALHVFGQQVETVLQQWVNDDVLGSVSTQNVLHVDAWLRSRGSDDLRLAYLAACGTDEEELATQIGERQGERWPDLYEPESVYGQVRMRIHVTSAKTLDALLTKLWIDHPHEVENVHTDIERVLWDAVGVVVPGGDEMLLEVVGGVVIAIGQLDDGTYRAAWTKLP